MVLQTENVRKKKFSLEICQRNYSVGKFPSVIVAYAIMFSQLSWIIPSVIVVYVVNVFQLSEKYRRLVYICNFIRDN